MNRAAELNTTNNPNIKHRIKALFKIIFLCLNALFAIWLMIIITFPCYYSKEVLPNEVVQATINFQGEVELIFNCNTIVKVLGNENNYQIKSHENQKDYGSIIKLISKRDIDQSFKVTFIDDTNKNIDINFVVSYLGSKVLFINDKYSPHYLTFKNKFEDNQLPSIERNIKKLENRIDLIEDYIFLTKEDF